MGASLLLLPSPSAPACCSCAAGVAGSRRLAATPSSPSSVASTLRLLRPLCRRQRRASVARAAGGGGGEGDGGKSGAAAFFGEDGVVEDMDGYMDYLSLEYDSVWDTKPACIITVNGGGKGAFGRPPDSDSTCKRFSDESDTPVKSLV